MLVSCMCVCGRSLERAGGSVTCVPVTSVASSSADLCPQPMQWLSVHNIWQDKPPFYNTTAILWCLWFFKCNSHDMWCSVLILIIVGLFLQTDWFLKTPGYWVLQSLHKVTITCAPHTSFTKKESLVQSGLYTYKVLRSCCVVYRYSRLLSLLSCCQLYIPWTSWFMLLGQTSCNGISALFNWFSLLLINHRH